ncbi:lipid asymmetry maintenance protein MlaB [Schlegelella aquatica]|uniref:STAS domain-containing protein n=1 Tax=Caldimonas aquatica TaxID=376175 RepID=UPI003751363E
MLLLPATVTVHEANDTLQMLTQALRRETGARLVVDASALAQFDSSVLAVLLECARQVKAAGKRLEVLHLPVKLRALAALYGVAELLPEAVA